MKREHSAYPEYFVTQDRKTRVWAWVANIQPFKATGKPLEVFMGTAASEEQARDLAQRAIAKAMPKYLKMES